MVIDLDALEIDDVRTRFPAVYQHVLTTVKPERDVNREPSRKQFWWRFGRRHTELRTALRGLRRYIATPETAKHRFFVFLDAAILPDNMLVNIATSAPTSSASFPAAFTSLGHSPRAAGSVSETIPAITRLAASSPSPFPTPPSPNASASAPSANNLTLTANAARKRIPT
jgi:hypothetical protein